MASTESNSENGSSNVTAPTAAAYTAGGTQRDAVTLPADLFDGTVNVPVMHQVVKAYLANQRQGTASTKTRSFVTGGNQKPWKQKGTGRARQGSTRAPHWVGGGTVFGPTPRDYRHDTNKKVRVLARKSALNARAAEQALFVIDRFTYDAPRTTQLLGLLESMNVADRKVLILTDGMNRNVYLSGRNLPRTHVMPFSDASTYHILWSDVVLIESGAIGESLAPVAESERPARKAATKKTATKKTAAGTETAKAATKTATKTASRSAAKTAAKKSAPRKES